jgi:HEAT repeat protein
MPGVITTCTKCNCQFQWNTDYQDMPDCPNCGFNPQARFRSAGVDGLIKLLDSRDELERNHAAAQLGDRGDRRAVEPLINALRHSDASTRLSAVIALGKLGDPRAVGPLTAQMKRGDGPGNTAAVSLARIGTPEAIEALLNRVERLPPDAQIEVVDTLAAKGASASDALVRLAQSSAKYAQEDATRALKSLVKNIRNPAQKVEVCVRIRRWDVLRRMGNVAITELMKTLTQAADWPTRVSALEALEQIGWHPKDDAETLICALVSGTPQALADMGTRAIDPLVKHLTGGSPELQTAALQALARLGDAGRAKARDAMMGRVGTADIREAAAIALFDAGWVPQTDDESVSFYLATGDLKHLQALKPSAAPLLIAALQDLQSAFRQNAAKALGRLAVVPAIERLAAMLTCATSGDDQDAAAAALAQIGEPALDALGTALADTRASVHLRAIKAVETIGGSRARTLLADLFRKTPSRTLCVTVLDALQKLGWQPENPVERVKIGLIRSDVQALVSLSGEFPELVIAALDDEEPQSRSLAIEALGLCHDQSVQQRLIEVLVGPPEIKFDCPNCGQRLEAPADLYGQNVACPKCEAEIIIPQPATSSHSLRAKVAAAEALGQVGAGAAVAPLVATLSAVSPTLRSAAATALGKIGDASAAPALATLIENRDVSVRQHALSALLNMPSAMPPDAFVAALLNKNSAVREAARKAISQHGPIALPGLVVAMQNANDRIRVRAAEALSELMDERAMPHLVTATHDTVPRIRQLAACGLGRLASGRSPGVPSGILRVLRALVKNRKEVKSVRVEAAEAVKSITGKRPKVRGVDKECFVATATMGSHNHPCVLVLRCFRDQCLLPTRFGTYIVRQYYEFSPPFADWLEPRPAARRLTRVLLIQPVAAVAGVILAWIGAGLPGLAGRRRHGRSTGELTSSTPDTAMTGKAMKGMCQQEHPELQNGPRGRVPF